MTAEVHLPQALLLVLLQFTKGRKKEYSELEYFGEWSLRWLLFSSSVEQTPNFISKVIPDLQLFSS